MRKILLDTNAYSQFMSGNGHVYKFIAESDIIYLSVFVIAELLYGFKYGKKEKKNVDDLNAFCSRGIVRILDAGFETALVYAEIKIGLRKAGTPVPSNDLWIAAHAIETGSVLITSDTHFARIPGIRKEIF